MEKVVKNRTMVLLPLRYYCCYYHFSSTTTRRTVQSVCRLSGIDDDCRLPVDTLDTGSTDILSNTPHQHLISRLGFYSWPTTSISLPGQSTPPTTNRQSLMRCSIAMRRKLSSPGLPRTLQGLSPLLFVLHGEPLPSFGLPHHV